MEYECPDPFPSIRDCPPGIKIDGAFCYMGYIQLHCITSLVPPFQVFYYHPGSPGWHFVSPRDLKSFLALPEMYETWRLYPSFGENYIHNYFKGHVARHLEDISKFGPSALNVALGVP